MDRRQILKLGVALTTLPLPGCGASPPEPAPAPSPAGSSAPAAGSAAPADKPAAPRPAASADAPAHEDKAAEAKPNPPKDEPPKVAFTRVVGRLGKNHGHVLTITLADVMAGAEKTYEIKGTATHPHAVTLSADDMKSLLTGKLLRTNSTNNNHAHRVVVRCAPAVDPPEWVNVCKFSSSGADEHEIVITAADMAAKAEKTYDIRGLAGHSHEVALSAADFEKLLKGGPVTLHSSRDPDDAHLHTVTIEYHVKAKA